MKRLMLLIMSLVLLTACQGEASRECQPITFSFATNIGYFFKKDDNEYLVVEEELDHNLLLESGDNACYEGKDLKGSDYYTVIDGERYEFNYVDKDDVTFIILE